MLVGQYTNYLKRQIELYLKGDRPHDVVADEEDEDGEKAKKTAKPRNLGILARISEKDINDILAHITHLQDAQP
jgi:cytochrome c553